jgi:hypothetical protein
MATIDASYQFSVHLDKRFQRRRFKKIGISETRIACGGHVMTSFKLGDAPFVKHVGSTTIFVRSNISQTSFKALHF